MTILLIIDLICDSWCLSFVVLAFILLILRVGAPSSGHPYQLYQMSHKHNLQAALLAKLLALLGSNATGRWNPAVCFAIVGVWHSVHTSKLVTRCA